MTEQEFLIVYENWGRVVRRYRLFI